MIRSLTYAELAAALKITPESANRLARRKRWPRAKGNDGRVRVTVPEEIFVRRDSSPDRPPDGPGDSPQVSPPDNNPVHAQIARLEGELAGVREALAEARVRAAAAETQLERQQSDFAARAAQLVSEVAAERARTERAIEAFSGLADRLDALAAARQHQPFLIRLKRRLVG